MMQKKQIKKLNIAQGVKNVGRLTLNPHVKVTTAQSKKLYIIIIITFRPLARSVNFAQNVFKYKEKELI